MNTVQRRLRAASVAADDPKWRHPDPDECPITPRAEFKRQRVTSIKKARKVKARKGAR